MRGVPALLDLRLVALEVDVSAEICKLHLCSSVWWDLETLKPISDKGGKATALARGQLCICEGMFLIKGHSRS